MRADERRSLLLASLKSFGIHTPETIQIMLFPDESPNVITKLTSQMCKARDLNRHRLPANHVYFTFGPKGARECGVSMKAVKPRGPIALTRAIGTLYFCARHKWQLLTREEANGQLPGIVVPEIDSEHYYLDREGEGPVRLAFVRVDCHAQVSHLVRRSRRDIDRRMNVPALRKFIEQDRFVIALITATEEKAAALKKAINAERLTCRFRMVVVPELLLVLGGNDARSAT